MRCAAGGGVTNKATRPTGVLTLSRQKEPPGDSSQTLLPGSATSANAQKSLPAQEAGRPLGVRQPSPPVCRLSGASPSGALSSSAFPDVYRDITRCGLRPLTRSALRAHNSCSIPCRPNKALFRSIPHCVTWLSAARVKTKPLTSGEFHSVLTRQHAMRPMVGVADRATERR